MFNIEIFAERVRELMFYTEIDLKKLATETLIPKSTLYYYLSKSRNPNIIALVLLADYFDCSIDFLIGREINKTD